MANLVVTNESVGQRLDLYLAMQLPKFSRTAVRKMLDQGKVRLNGEVEYRPNYKVNIGDEFEVEQLSDLSRKQLIPYDFPLDIVYEDQDLLVVNKPSGMKVHPSGLNDNQTLVNAAYHHVKDNNTEFGVSLVNRIDKGTSGLVVLALSPHGAWHYAKEFAQGNATKEYLTVVDQRWMSKFGREVVRESNFIRYDQLKRMQEVVQTRGEFAETEFVTSEIEFVGEGDADFDAAEYMVVVARPKTGRRHQIRIHLSHLGFPILGDDRYGGEEYPRLMLHAWRLKLKNPKGEVLSFEAELPAELRNDK